MGPTDVFLPVIAAGLYTGPIILSLVVGPSYTHLHNFIIIGAVISEFISDKHRDTGFLYIDILLNMGFLCSV